MARSRDKARGPRTGDLFEHYGVAERERPPSALPPAVVARPCASCSYIRPLSEVEPCEMCGAASTGAS